MANVTRPSITAIVLTKDEGLHIKRCIDSLTPAVERICIIDSGSSDETLQIARSMGAEVFENPWINYAAQFNWALDNCDIATDWVLRLDADEYLETDLQIELVQRLHLLPAETRGVLLKRKYFFLRRWVRHGGMHPIWHLRLWRKGSGRIENSWMDEHAILTAGHSIEFNGAFVDDNLRDLAWWSNKHVWYATREALQVILMQSDAAVTAQNTGVARQQQASRKRWIKENVYNHLPLGLGPLLYLIYRLFFRLGILDGSSGISFHVLQGFWYRLLVDLRRQELQRSLAGIDDADSRIEALEKLTGLRIRDFPVQ